MPWGMGVTYLDRTPLPPGKGIVPGVFHVEHPRLCADSGLHLCGQASCARCHHHIANVWRITYWHPLLRLTSPAVVILAMPSPPDSHGAVEGACSQQAGLRQVAECRARDRGGESSVIGTHGAGSRSALACRRRGRLAAWLARDFELLQHPGAARHPRRMRLDNGRGSHATEDALLAAAIDTAHRRDGRAAQRIGPAGAVARG